jgi:hypothetical protein
LLVLSHDEEEVGDMVGVTGDGALPKRIIPNSSVERTENNKTIEKTISCSSL